MEYCLSKTLPIEKGALPRMKAAGLSRMRVGVFGAAPVGVDIWLSWEVRSVKFVQQRRGERVRPSQAGLEGMDEGVGERLCPIVTHRRIGDDAAR